MSNPSTKQPRPGSAAERGAAAVARDRAENPAGAATHERSTEPVGVPAGRARNAGRLALVVALVVTLALFAWTLAPIAGPVLLGALLAGFMSPLRRRMLMHWRRPTLVAVVLTVGVVAFVLAPVALLVRSFVLQAPGLVAGGRAFFAPGGPWTDLTHRFPAIERLAPEGLAGHVGDAAAYFANSLPGVLSGAANVAVALFLVVVTLFYLLRDGPTVLDRVVRALPLEPGHTRAIVGEFARVGTAFIIGTLGTAAAQGLVAGIAYWIVGLSQALLLAVLTAVASVVPVAGSALVWAPVALFLFVRGEATHGIVVLAFGVLVIGVVDNVLRPLLGRSGLDLHPLLMFLAVFGGLAAFGPSGLYLGPLFVALFVAVARIYERELAPSLGAGAVNEDASTDVARGPVERPG